MKMLRTVLIISMIAAFSIPSNAGWNANSLSNLEVTVDYTGYLYRNSAGEPVYPMGSTVQYRVTIQNRSNRPFKNFPVSGTLFWGGAVVCTRHWSDGQTVSYGPLQSLPGNSVSGPHYLNIGPNSYSFFDGFYTIPNTVCPNRGVIHIDALRGGGPHDSLVIPMMFQVIQ